MSARAALDAARAEFEPSLGRPPIEATTTPEWREHRAGLESPHARGRAMWTATEQVLHVVVGRAALTGQALVGEARRRQFLTLGDAHALMALQGWMDRLREVTDADAPPGDHERMIAREAWTALEHAVDAQMAAPSQPSVAGSFAPPVDVQIQPADAHTGDFRPTPGRNQSDCLREGHVEIPSDGVDHL